MKGVTTMIEVTIREACEKKRMSAAQVAELVGISRQQITRYWRGNRIRSPNLDVLERIAKVLGVPALSLFKETPDE